MNKIWLKLLFGRATCILVAVVLLFALRGNARATAFISWDFTNTPTTVGPTETIDMRATVVTSDGDGFVINGAILINMYESLFLEPGLFPNTLVDVIIDPEGNAVEAGAGGPYRLLLREGFLANPLAEYNGSANFLFGVLEPIGGVAPLGTFTSGQGDVRFFSSTNSIDYVLSVSGFTVNVVPEPSTMLLLASGLAGLAAWRRKRAA